MEFIDSTGQLIRTKSTPLYTTPQIEEIAQAQSDYMARTKLQSSNYTNANARLYKARRAYKLAPSPELYAKYIKALAESEQATKEYYS